MNILEFTVVVWIVSLFAGLLGSLGQMRGRYKATEYWPELHRMIWRDKKFRPGKLGLTLGAREA